MIEWILSTLKQIFSDIRSAIIALIVFVLVGGTAGFLALSERTLNLFLAVMQTETPIWATIVLTLLVVIYIHLKTSKIHSSVEPQHKPFLIEDSGLKWKITDKNNGNFTISNMPYCTYHNYQYLETPASQFMCPELMNSSCKSKVIENNDELLLFKNIATSKAELIINNYKTKN